MKLLKKFKWVFIGFAILFLIVGVWIGKDFFKAQYGALYGNRLVGIEDVPITDADSKNIKDYLLATEGIKKVETNVHGKILSIIILVDETMTLDKAKQLSNETLTKCSDEQKGFYDITFFIDYEKDTDKTDFPIIGYKNKNSTDIIW